jgi:phosphatidylinositol phospholipase C delta
LQLLRTDASDADSGYYTDPSSSASDSDAFFEMMKNVSDESAAKKIRRQSDSTVKRSFLAVSSQFSHLQLIQRQSGQLSKASTNILQRVRSVGRGGLARTPEHVLSQSPPFTPATPTTPLLGQPTPVSLSPLSATHISPTIAHRLSDAADAARPKPKMSMALIALLVYTVGVKCRGINKKEEYAPEHVFSLSENIANKMLRFSMWDLIKHTKTHVVRTYPKGLRLNSTNYEPHRFWAAGAQLVAINWQTFGVYSRFDRRGFGCLIFFSVLPLDRPGLHDQPCDVSA